MMRPYLISLVILTLSSLAKAEPVTIAAGNVAASLELNAPDGAKVIVKGGKTTISTKKLWLYIWAVPNAKTVGEALPQVNEVIKSEVTDFVVGSTEVISVAGGDATHLKGKGTEADDGDPGTTDVVVFAAGKNVFAACVHGEGAEAAKERSDMLSVLKTAKPL